MILHRHERFCADRAQSKYFHCREHPLQPRCQFFPSPDLTQSLVCTVTHKPHRQEMVPIVCSLLETPPHHFVFVTLEADDAALVAASIGTHLAAGVLQLQDISVPRRTRLHLPQIHIVLSGLQTGRCTGGTLPCTCREASTGSALTTSEDIPSQSALLELEF